MSSASSASICCRSRSSRTAFPCSARSFSCLAYRRSSSLWLRLGPWPWASSSSRRAKSALMVRHDAALALVERGDLDPVLALSLVVRPRRGSRLEDVPLGKQVYSDDVREEIRRRPFEEGETLPELALKTSIPYAQVKSICSAAGAR